MSNKIIKSLIEHSSLTDFEKEFKEAVEAKVNGIVECMRRDLKAEFTLEEASSCKYEDESAEDSEKEAEEKDGLTEYEMRVKGKKKKMKMSEKSTRQIPGMEGPYTSPKGMTYFYDPKEGMYYDPSTDLYVTAGTLGIKK